MHKREVFGDLKTPKWVKKVGGLILFLLSIYIEGSRVMISKKIVHISLKIDSVLPNSA